jgi:hypothetical protein
MAARLELTGGEFIQLGLTERRLVQRALHFTLTTFSPNIFPDGDSGPATEAETQLGVPLGDIENPTILTVPQTVAIATALHELDKDQMLREGDGACELLPLADREVLAKIRSQLPSHEDMLWKEYEDAIFTRH